MSRRHAPTCSHPNPTPNPDPTPTPTPTPTPKPKPKPKPKPNQACSDLLPPEQRRLAIEGIDHSTKEEYDALFNEWIRCPHNMAANRQARALSYTVDRNATARMRASLCDPALPPHDPAGLCQGRIARHTLLQFSYFGLLEERCLSEKLFEAHFGLRFSRSKGAHAHGKGAHAVSKLAFENLTQTQQRQVRWLNRNDLWLYGEAQRIFYERLRLYGISRDATCT